MADERKGNPAQLNCESNGASFFVCRQIVTQVWLLRFHRKPAGSDTSSRAQILPKLSRALVNRGLPVKGASGPGYRNGRFAERLEDSTRSISWKAERYADEETSVEKTEADLPTPAQWQSIEKTVVKCVVSREVRFLRFLPVMTTEVQRKGNGKTFDIAKRWLPELPPRAWY